MKWLSYEPRRFFLLGMRLSFGLWLLYVGLAKWIFPGPDTFVGFIAAGFDKTWSPHLLNVSLAWLILIAEPVLAAWILSGRNPRMAWMMTSLLLFLLTVGQTILMKPDVIANWQYLVLVLVCASLSDPDEGTRAVERFNEAFGKRDVDGIMKAMTTDCIFENTCPPPDGERYVGREAVRGFWERFFRSSPSAEFAAEEMFACGDRCVVRWIYRWEETGGRSGHIRGVDIFRVRDGKVSEKLSYVKG